MFKFSGIISKYLTTFIIITILTVFLITSAAVILVSTFSINNQTQSLQNYALSVEKYIESEYSYSDYENFGNFVYYNQKSLKLSISLLVHYSNNTSVIVVDDDGTVLLFDTKSETDEPDSIDEQYFNGTTLKRFSNISNLDGLFEKNQKISSTPIFENNKNICGYVIVCAPFEIFNETVSRFIALALCICVSMIIIIVVTSRIISKKISVPLGEINFAAKKFASGEFDVRVPVVGHDEFTELAVAFNNMAESLQNAEESRRNLLASVSHDLKTPMTTISGFIEGIIDGAISPEKQGYYLNIINDEVQRLSRLVTQLLDITRIQAGERKFNMQPFDVCEVARLILISLEQKIENKGLDVEFNCDEDRITVLADRDAIYQIIYNLCHNAIKFSDENGKLKINIMIKEQKCFISVYNTGMGIDKEELPFVFDRFYKSDKSRGLDKTGTGLGLFISKAIISAHEEEIWVKSEAGKYCEFVFTLKRTLDATETKR